MCHAVIGDGKQNGLCRAGKCVPAVKSLHDLGVQDGRQANKMVRRAKECNDFAWRVLPAPSSDW